VRKITPAPVPLEPLTTPPRAHSLDDAFLSPIFSSATAAAAAAAAAAPAALGPAALAREGASLALATLVVMLSVPVVRNILSPNQVAPPPLRPCA
jgi:hypothetical protein